MGKLVGSTGQYTGAEYLFDASGTIVSGSVAQLVLPKAKSRSSLIIQNVSSANMWVEFGGARATAALTTKGVSSCTITNAGFGYSIAPNVKFLGGAYQNPNKISPTYTLQGLPDWPAPSHPATAHCVMSGAAGSMTVSSIVIDDPGANYCYPPYVWLDNMYNDLYGAADPSVSPSGILLIANGGSYTSNGTICTTDQVAIYCASASAAFTCKYAV